MDREHRARAVDRGREVRRGQHRTRSGEQRGARAIGAITVSERARRVGGVRIVADPGGVKIVAVLTVGYDPAKKKYVGSWVDSVQTNMWIYEGTVSEDGKTFSLLADGPGFADPAKTAKYKDAWEFKSKDHIVLTGSVQGDDGKWTTFMTANYRRKK